MGGREQKATAMGAQLSTRLERADRDERLRGPESDDEAGDRRAMKR